MAVTVDSVKRRFPIHWLIWNEQHEELKASLDAGEFTSEELEAKDPRGRTPLLLAVTLGQTESVRALIDAGADINCEKDGWTAVQEATATGNAEILSLVLSRRDYQRHSVRAGGIPDLLRRLSLAPDFYVEMKWEFTSWVPLVSRICPFDTYKVYKRGGNVRVDTTLVGFENNRWQRGDRTYIFRGQGNMACLMELDHEAGTVWCENVEARTDARAWPAPSARHLRHRLRTPLVITYLDTDKISFERNKSGIWGWRQDKMESVNGYECKVFSANNVELVSKTRTEHIPKGERRPSPRAPFAGLLSLADNDVEINNVDPDTPLITQENEDHSTDTKCSERLEPVSLEEYFSDEPLERDIGRPREISTKVQKFKATLCLCENYPLELQEQIMPILDLMASMSSPHFAKLKDFVQMQLPSGFPVKIEIPLFHVLNARITFGNIFATETPVTHIESIQEGERLSCVVDDNCFNIGRGYRDVAATDERLCMDGEDGLLQYAIQQSLMEAGTQEDQVDVWEALRGARPSPCGTPPPVLAPNAPGAATLSTGATRGTLPAAHCADTDHTPPELFAHEERELQRAIEASLASLSSLALCSERGTGVGAEAEPAAAAETEPGAPGATVGATTEAADIDVELQTALALSVQEQARRDHELAAEQKALDDAIRLSLIDK